jgi:hypothetical protein
MYRYETSYGVSSSLDPLCDVIVLFGFLTTRHGISKADAARRASVIVPHIRTALSFVEQSLASREELSFLPAYYAILNLLKVYVLVGPHHAQLPNQRWHGATYPVGQKVSRHLLTEYVTLKQGGAIPLFYRTVTGQQMPTTRIPLSDIYPFVTNIGGEYPLATQKRNLIRDLDLMTQPHKKFKNRRTLHANVVRVPGDTRRYTPKDFKVLNGFRSHPSNPDVFVGKNIPSGATYADPAYRDQFRPYLVYAYDHATHRIRTPVSSRRLLLPEELPIALLFFHMSSVVRYNPEFLAKIRDSRYWPMLAAARRHCVLRALILAWEYVNQQNLALRHGS